MMPILTALAKSFPIILGFGIGALISHFMGINYDHNMLVFMMTSMGVYIANLANELDAF